MTDGAILDVVLVGAGGYGRSYLSALAEEGAANGLRLVGGGDSYALEAALPGSPAALVFDSPAAFFAAGRHADLAIISSPIHAHAPQTCEALAHGCHVLCEKPVAATIQDLRRMIKARDAARRSVAVGYQWSFSTPIQALKRDLLRGDFGRPLCFKTMTLWPRSARYYQRNDWAGAKTTAAGEWILDSPVNNATAHYLHNMLYILGPDTCAAAVPTTVTAELYRANPIRNYDTAALRVRAADTDVFFLTTHAVERLLGPVFELVCEQAVVRFPDPAGNIRAELPGGRVRTYAWQPGDDRRKLFDLAQAIRDGRPPLCGLEAAAGQTLCMNGAQEAHDIGGFDRRLVAHRATDDGDDMTYVIGLADAFEACYAEARMPSEKGLPWAIPGRSVDLRAYRRFPAVDA